MNSDQTSSESGDAVAVGVMLKEYEMMRQEITTSMQTRGSILTFAFTIIGAIFAAALTSDKGQDMFVGFVLILGVPSIALFTLLQWLGEYERMQRAGKFILNLESRINKMTVNGALSWETHLRDGRLHMSYPYNSTVLGIIILSVIGVTLGFLKLPYDPSVLFGFYINVVIIHVPIYLFLVERMNKVRNHK